MKIRGVKRPARCLSSGDGVANMKRRTRQVPVVRRNALQLERFEPRTLLAADLVITELLARNETGLRDEDGDRSDWIEVANLGDESADLSGWALTDDAEQPQKWPFPSLTLAPGAVQLVFASDKDRRASGGPLHTNFKLDGDGEYLSLVNPTGSTVSSYAPFPPQIADVSYGQPSSNSEATGPRYFDQPTPGELNKHSGFAGYLDGVKMDLSHGFYEAPQTLTLRTQTPGASLAYRLDGSDPALQTASAQIVNPDSATSLVTHELSIMSTTTVRVTEVMSDHLPSETSTRSYLFVADIIHQSADGTPPEGWPTRPVNRQRFDYGMDPDVVDDPHYAEAIADALLDIPSVSIVMDRDDLFDSERGFFVNGERSRTLPRSWERATSVELIHPDHSEGFQIDAGIRMRGGYSRRPENAKHAFRLFFRDEYGDGALQYPLFGSEGAQSFDNIDLRTAQVPSWSLCTPGASPTGGGCEYNTMLRDVLARDLQRSAGQPHSRSRFYHLYLNGQYWGLFQSQERTEASYAESYFGGDADDYDVIKVESFPHRTVATDGNLAAWRQLWETSMAGFTDNANYLRLQGLNEQGVRDEQLPVLLDVDNLIDYMLITLYSGNLDGPISNFLDNEQTNNWFGIYNRNGEHGFQFFVHDSEWILFDVEENRNGPWPAGQSFAQSNPQWLHQQLMQNTEYRLKFADRAQQHLFDGGILTPTEVLRHLDQRASEIDLAIIAESARWGDARRSRPYTKEDWLEEVDRLRSEVIPIRTDIVIQQLRNTTLSDGTSAPLLPRLDAPRVTRGFEPSAALQLNAIIDGAHDVYYTLDGSDPRARASTVDTQALVTAGAIVRYHVPLDDTIHDVWHQLDFDDSNWSTGPTGIGFDRRGTSFPDLVATDLDADMRGINSSVYLRIAFEFSANETVDLLKLRMRYDDGFVAYLNGQPITRASVDEPLTWDAQANATRNNRDANRIQEFDVSHLRNQLRVGTNVLAIQGLNRTASGSDFLIWPELIAETVIDVGLSNVAQLYTHPISINDSLIVRARSWRNGQWSTLVELPFQSETIVGDVNGDTIFNSADLVALFQRGEYEDDLMGNSTWADGDWTGDREFTTSDLVLALQLGNYQSNRLAFDSR